MRIQSLAPHRKARIEIIPLIDIMFFLLATFIMVSLSMLKNMGIPVNLPSAHSAKASDSKPSATISVTQDGKVYWDKQETTLDELPAKLKALGDPDAKVFIHGDKKADFGTVVKVLDETREAGIKHTAIRTTSARK